MTQKTGFRFQRFGIAHDRCGMKVGTDGILLGAWADIAGAKKFLDIGTGSGLIALMLAQRTESTEAVIEAVEIDHAAASQAAENFLGSPWKNRLRVHSKGIQEAISKREVLESAYDAIVCNPPFFSASLKPTDRARSNARHTTSLRIGELWSSVRYLIAERGRVSLILPVEQVDVHLRAAEEVGLLLNRRTNVRPLPDRPAKRVLLEFARQPSAEPLCEDQILEESRHQYSVWYRNLTAGFYLKH